MKIRVDLELCQDHGQCTLAAPDVFTLTENGLEYDESPAAEHHDAVEEAVDACPVQAISLSA